MAAGWGLASSYQSCHQPGGPGHFSASETLSQEHPRWRQTARRVSFWVLLLGIGYLVYRVLDAQPLQVQVVYHLGDARPTLTELAISYQRGGEELRRITYRYSKRAPAPARQINAVSLPKGSYELLVTLHFEHQTAPRVLRRPLLVSGEGSVGVYLTGAGSKR